MYIYIYIYVYMHIRLSLVSLYDTICIKLWKRPKLIGSRFHTSVSWLRSLGSRFECFLQYRPPQGFKSPKAKGKPQGNPWQVNAISPSGASPPTHPPPFKRY